MKGLFIGHYNENKVKASKDGEELSLIARGDGVEIMLQCIKPDTLVTLSPSEGEQTEDLMEFFHILSGNMEYEQENQSIILGEGDYFYTYRLKDTSYLKTITEVKMLYVSSQPVFHLLSNEINELKNILKELEEKDLYTHDHDVRLVDYSMKIGEKLMLSKRHLEMLYYAALFHDIGKIKTPMEILNKPGRLTDGEFKVIKNHPLDGKTLLDKTFLNFVSEIISEHHERLNGSGYPFGLKDDEISLEAKIIAVVDSYDAMTSDRAYHRAMEPAAAICDIKRLVGTHYDEKIVNTFEEILKFEGIL